MNETKKTLRGPGGIRIELDRSEVFPNDPGNGTPALVYCRGNTATYWCACGEGEVDGIMLSEGQMEWLENQSYTIDSFLYG